ncbi:MAG TPA: FMN-binding negative transcriptional regulator [Kofleriaceae bacterium]|nr:FMN-binding negative transcriptional regulator [Kofleriaceae bacterium]
MYVPTHFEEPRTEILHDLIERFPLGVLITHGAAGLDANHIPFHLVRDGSPLGTLHAHVARKNPVWREVASGDEVLVVFRADHAYISPSWYPSKHELHNQVPTWNYTVAHAHGAIAIRDDERFVRGVVGRLTKHHEAGEPVPWKMSDSSQELIATLIEQIVGIEIPIARLVGKAKLGQNKEARDQRGAGEALIARGHAAIGEAMRTLADAKPSSTIKP